MGTEALGHRVCPSMAEGSYSQSVSLSLWHSLLGKCSGLCGARAWGIEEQEALS